VFLEEIFYETYLNYEVPYFNEQSIEETSMKIVQVAAIITLGTMLLAGCNTTKTFSVAVTDFSVAQGETASAAVTITRSGNTDPVQLVLEDATGTAAPTGITGIFTPNLTATNASTLKLTVTNAVAVKSYALRVKATSAQSNITQTASFKLTVTPKPSSTFDLGINPASQTIEQGKDASVAVTVTRVNFTPAIDVKLETEAGTALPAGLTGTFTPSSAGGSLKVAVGAGVPAADYALQVTATGGGITKSQPFKLTVQKPLPPALPINKGTVTIANWTPAAAGTFLSALNSTPVTNGSITSYYSTSISAGGVVTYDLPVPTLVAASSLFSKYCTTGLTVSPSDAKGETLIFGASSGTKYGELVITDREITTIPPIGFKQAFVAYIDKDATATGNCTSSVAGASYKLTLNLTLKLGWNVIIATVTDVTGSTITANAVSATTIPGNLSWRYRSVN
jgi:hypothetical protein